MDLSFCPPLNHRLARPSLLLKLVRQHFADYCGPRLVQHRIVGALNPMYTDASFDIRLPDFNRLCAAAKSTTSPLNRSGENVLAILMLFRQARRTVSNSASASSRRVSPLREGPATMRRTISSISGSDAI